MLTQEELKKWLRYYPQSGDFIWLRGVRAGKLAGHQSKFGRTIQILGKQYSARHIAWLYMTGDFPPDGQNVHSTSQNPFSVKWSDLSITPAGCREMTNCKINHAITRGPHKNNKYNSTGIKGVSLHKPTGLYRASICFNKKQHSLGYYRTIEEAEMAVISGRERLSHMIGD